MVTILTKEFDVDVAKTYCVLQEKTVISFIRVIINDTVVNNYCLFNDQTQVYIFCWQSTTMFL